MTDEFKAEFIAWLCDRADQTIHVHRSDDSTVSLYANDGLFTVPAEMYEHLRVALALIGVETP